MVYVPRRGSFLRVTDKASHLVKLNFIFQSYGQEFTSLMSFWSSVTSDGECIVLTNWYHQRTGKLECLWIVFQEDR